MNSSFWKILMSTARHIWEYGFEIQWEKTEYMCGRDISLFEVKKR